MPDITCPICGAVNPANAKYCRICGLPLISASAAPHLGSLDYLPPGYIFKKRPDIQIEKVIGQGGFAIVYKVFHKGFNTSMAVKEFFPQGTLRDPITYSLDYSSLSYASSVPQLRQNFEDEAKVLVKLMHPNLIRIYDTFQENNTVYIVMEYIEGKTLKELVKNTSPLSISLLTNLIDNIASALDYLHKNGYVHRDVSPNNIMYKDNDNIFILLDLGSVKSLGQITSLLMVTDNYSPPELHVSNVPATPATDIYSFSAVLYYAITGDHPPSAKDLQSGVKYLAFPSNVNVPKEVINVIRRGMLLSMQFRPQTMDIFKDLLKKLTSTRITTPLAAKAASAQITKTISIPPAGATKYLQKKSSRVVVGILDYKGVYEIKALELDSSRRIKAEIPLTRFKGIKSVEQLSFTLDGHYAAAKLKKQQGDYILSLIETSTGNKIKEYDDVINIFAMFSFNGNYLVVKLTDSSNNVNIEIISVTSGRVLGRREYQRVEWVYLDFTYASKSVFVKVKYLDGTELVELLEVPNARLLNSYESKNKANFVPAKSREQAVVWGKKNGKFTMQVINTSSGKVIADLGEENYIYSPRFSPDDKYVAVWIRDSDKTLTLRLIDTTTWRPILNVPFPNIREPHYLQFTPDASYLISWIEYHGAIWRLIAVNLNTKKYSQVLGYKDVEKVESKFSPNSKYMISLVKDINGRYLLDIFEVNAWRHARHFDYGIIEKVDILGFSRGGDYLLIRYGDKKQSKSYGIYGINIIDTHSLNIKIKREYKIVEKVSAKFTLDGKFVAIHVVDDTGRHNLEMIELATNKLVKKYNGRSIIFDVLPSR